MVLSLWITDYCNLNCSYCYINKKEKNNMTINMQDNILNFIKHVFPLSDSSGLAIKFFGGEPTLNLEFIENFVQRINLEKKAMIKGPVDFLLTTNGTLLNEENIKFFKKNNIQISLSIDGNEEVNKMHRSQNGNSYWDILNKNITLLLSEIPESIARMTYTSKTFKDLDKSIDFLVKKGFKNIKPIPDYFDEDWNDEDIHNLRKMLLKIKDKYLKEYKSKGVRITTFQSEELLSGYIGCSGGYKSFSIASNGDIYPCTYAVKEKEFVLGNIKDYQKFKIHKHITEHEKRHECFGCMYFKSCKSGRCIYINYKLTGDFYKPSGFFCEYSKLLVEINEDTLQLLRK